MSHYVKNIGHPHTIDSKIKSGLADKGESGTHIRPDDPHENTHKQGHTIFFLSACDNRITSNTACTLELTQFPDKGREAHLLSGLSHSSHISTGKLCDAGCKSIFDEQIV